MLLFEDISFKVNRRLFLDTTVKGGLSQLKLDSFVPMFCINVRPVDTYRGSLVLHVLLGSSFMGYLRNATPL